MDLSQPEPLPPTLECLHGQLRPRRPRRTFRAAETASTPFSPRQGRALRGTYKSPSAIRICNVFGRMKDFKEKLRELEETAAKMEKEIKEDIRNLLFAIEQRDKTLLASRKAYQKLDLDCKSAIQVSNSATIRSLFVHCSRCCLKITLKKLMEKELDNARVRLNSMETLSKAVQAIDIDRDMQQFIARSSCEGQV